MSAPLTFGDGSNPFAGDDHLTPFDCTADIDLSGFDAADGTTTVPAGVYLCKIERGELTQTKAGKTAYRLLVKTVEPAAHAGFALWRWYVLADAAGANRAKAALAPLGLTTSADLRRAYPPIGQDVYVTALVTVKNDPQRGPSNDVERFERCDPPASAVVPPNPSAVPLRGAADGDVPPTAPGDSAAEGQVP